MVTVGNLHGWIQFWKPFPMISLLLVMVLLVVVMLRTGMELLVVGLVVFVTLINITSGILLLGEWKKQRSKLKEILSLYE